MADHDQALAWAQANPNDPRAKDVMAKAWASQNPNDPRASQIMQRLGSQRAAPGQPPQQDNLLTRLAKNYAQYMGGVVGGGVEGLTLGNYKPQWAEDLQKDAPIGSAVGRLAGGATTGSMLGGLAGAPASALGRIAANTGSSALQGLMKAPEEGETRTGNALKQGAIGGVISGGAEALSSGASKLADYLAQRSVGMRKYMPGVGNSLVDQGVVGTKNMMTNQVGDKLANEEQNLQRVVSGLKGNTDAQEIGDAIAERGSKFQLPSSGDVAPNMESYADKVKNAAGQFQSMGEGGELTPQDLLAIKRQGDWLGYTNSGNPATSLEAELGRAQADKARSLLSGMSDNATAESLGRERALILAKKALEKPEAIHQGMGSMAIFGKIPGTSLLESLGAQAAQKGVAAPASTIADPKVLQALFGASNGSSVK